MDNTGVRVPMTRMRRKLSVEQNEEAMSPSTPSTPTKKRPTRLTKPLLDNIDENLTVSSPRRVTKKSVSKDHLELNEEKISTPSRRNIRIKSNTSITSETTQTFDSPRARRAARRNSLAGSDTEGPATPVRQTRRARKDSSSSIENQGETLSKPSKPLIEETILEEPVHNKLETDVSPNSDKSSNSSLTTLRKSPRLLAKKGILTTPDHTSETISEDNNIINNEKDNSSKESKPVLDTSVISNIAGDEMDVSTKSKRKSDGLDKSTSKDISQDEKNNESARKISLSQKIQEDLEDDIANEDSNDSTTYDKNISNSLSLKETLNTDDQCVPVVDQNIVLDSTVITGDNVKEMSCEPMDVDETITENVSYRNITKNSESKNNSILSVNQSQNSKVASPIKVDNLSNRKLSVSFSVEAQKDTSLLHSKNNTLDAQNNNTKRKSSSFEISKPNESGNQSKILDENTIQSTKPYEVTDNLNNKLKCDTPLKHKDLQNLGIQTSTPNIGKHDKTTKSTSANNSKHDLQDSSSDDNSSDVIQPNECSLVNDEAEDVGDYESGDSQDEEEKRYVKENEIVERGETLSSEEDLSNDSDYEKDSFIVSSNEEDDELLSGTGDDLESSDNELTMSAKSKLKYNERKNKERIRASKEMFESRHRSERTKSETFDDVITRGKKGKRQRIESVDESKNQNSSTSEDEKVCKSKIGKNRQRLDSTLDDVHNNSKNATIRQDYTKSPNESKRENNKKMSEYSFTNKENEITTVFNESNSNSKDPLAIKNEPTTPNVSMNVTGVGQIEEVQIDENVSIIKSTTTSDPLQEASDDSASLSSENEEIKTNYESVLASLNNSPSKQKLKMFDNSFNLNKGTNKKVKQHPIIDQLNITQTKKDLRNAKSNKIVMDKKESNKSNEDIDGPDYTNLSVEVNVDSSDNSETDDYEKLVVNDNADFIPLVQSNHMTFEREISTQDNEVLDANTIEADLDKFLSRKKRNSNQFSDTNNEITDESINIPLNDSASRKNKNRKNSGQYNEVVPQNNEITDETTNTTLNDSTIKKKKNRNNSVQHIEIVSQDNEVTGETTNTTFDSTIKKKKTRKNSGQHVEIVPQGSEVTEETTNTTLNDSTIKKKKTRKNSGQHVEIVPQDNVVTEETTNTTLNDSTIKKKKNRNNSGQHVEIVLQDNLVTEKTTNTTLNDSTIKKKKNRKNSGQYLEIVPQENVVTEETTNTTLNDSTIKKKKNRKNSGQHVEIVPQDNEVTDETTNVILNESCKKKKKNQNISEQYAEIVQQDNEVTDISKNADLDISSSKKNKNRKRSEQSIETSLIKDNDTNSALDVSSTKKKKKIKTPEHVEIIPQDEEIKDKHTQNKKHKCQTSDQRFVVLDKSINIETTDPSIKKKKKQKKLDQDIQKTELADLETAINQSEVSNPGIRNKRRRQSSSDLTKSEDVDTVTESTLARNNKKRKVSAGLKIETKTHSQCMKRKRDDVEGLVQMKVFKDEFNIRRLPFTVIDQLDEKAVKPNKSNKNTKPSEVVSTVTFNVEETKQKKIKNKPSRYLEDSVYIDTDDQSINEKPNRNKIKKPKVLPFLPTVSTSSYGCTTNFKINIIPNETAFVAKATDIPNFKDNYLYNQKIKRLGTFEKYKRNIKLSKF